MKLFRSKSIGVQRKALSLALTRVRKVSTEITELSRRDWRGGELSIASKVNESKDALTLAIENMREAETHLKELERMAVSRGK